jgi:hypothetical protein
MTQIAGMETIAAGMEQGFNEDDGEPLTQTTQEEQRVVAFSEADISILLQTHCSELKDMYSETVAPVLSRWRVAAGPDARPLVHLMTQNNLLDPSTGRLWTLVGVEDRQQQKLRSDQALEDMMQSGEALKAFLGAFREHPTAWLNEALEPLRRWIVPRIKTVLSLLYHTRMFHFALTAALSDVVDDGMGYTYASFKDSAHFKDIYSFQPLDSIDIRDDRTKLVLYMLNQFAQRRWRKKKGSDFIYQEIKTPTVVTTYSYKPSITIEEAIYKLVDKDERGDLFSAIIREAIVRDVAHFLERGEFREFPFLIVEPRWFSFLDGIYAIEASGGRVDVFVPYARAMIELPELGRGSCTYNFIAMAFGPVYYHDDGSKRQWRDIPLGRFEKIFRDQDWTDRMIELKLATMGRTLWYAGEKDNAQYITVDIGPSGTGKSTVIGTWMQIFHFSDIMIFGPNQEKGFSKERLVDGARIFFAPDARGDSFGMSVEFFLVVATNDPCVFPRKHRDPLYVDSIKTPGMIATNELPAAYMKDIRGSIHRRLLPFPYTKTPEERVPGMKDDIVRHELAGLLRKSALAYLDPEVHPKTEDIMTGNRLPEQIARERRKLQRASNALVDFLDSEFVHLDPAQSTHKNDFIQTFGDFCRNVRQHRPPNFLEDYYKDPFDATGLSIETTDEEVLVVGCRIISSPTATMGDAS